MLSDYSTEGPLVVPHTMERRVDGEEVMTVKVDTFEINPKIDEGLFQKPAGA